jgi:DNA (cytosine-5)-methyltransferase 1
MVLPNPDLFATVDLFAGGGGASRGIEQATGRSPFLAVNHCPAAIAMHQANHPHTEHRCESVFDVDPIIACRGRKVHGIWASPDCKHHSRAKGGKPLDKKIRGLANIVITWAYAVRPRLVFVENVAEFEDWGPLYPEDHPDEKLRNRPIPERKGELFQRWVSNLRALGYQLEWRVLNAAEYGTPTKRKRLFVIARRDGKPIKWPTKTHGPGLLPFRTAGECIDWSIPCPSIFLTKAEAKAQKLNVRRPLADKTMARIAEGVKRYVLDTDEPYIVPGGAGYGVVTGNGERAGQTPRTIDVRQPMKTITASGSQGAVVQAFLAKHYTGVIGSSLADPLGTITAKDHHSLVSAHLTKFYGTSTGASLTDPLPTITASGGRGGGHLGLVEVRARKVAAFITAYYGTDKMGANLSEPMRTIVSKARFGLVTVEMRGEPYVIVDIGMRMLQPRELATAQGFGPDYVLTGTKGEQIARIGNSVCPPLAAAVVAAQLES